MGRLDLKENIEDDTWNLLEWDHQTDAHPRLQHVLCCAVELWTARQWLKVDGINGLMGVVDFCGQTQKSSVLLSTFWKMFDFRPSYIPAGYHCLAASSHKAWQRSASVFLAHKFLPSTILEIKRWHIFMKQKRKQTSSHLIQVWLRWCSPCLSTLASSTLFPEAIIAFQNALT